MSNVGLIRAVLPGISRLQRFESAWVCMSIERIIVLIAFAVNSVLCYICLMSSITDRSVAHVWAFAAVML